MLKTFPHRSKVTTVRIAVAVLLAAATHGCTAASGEKTLERQLTGVAYISRVTALIQALQIHRSLSAAYVQGDASVDFVENEQRISEKLTLIDRFATQHDEVQGARERWTPLKNDVRDLIENWRTQPRECIDRHTQLITTARTLVAYLADVSTLRSDTAVDIKSLAETATTTISEFTESVGKTSDMVTNLAAQGGMVREEERALFSQQAAAIRDHLEQIKANYNKAYAVDNRIRSQLDPQRELVGQLTAALLTLLHEEVVRVEFVKMSPDAWSPRATATMESAQTLQDLSLSALQGCLNARKARS